MEEVKAPDPENIWEAVQTITGDTYIYHKGFKEDADIRDVVKVIAGIDGTKNIVFQFSRYDFNPVKPACDSKIRMNRSIIAFAWYVDPFSDVITSLKEKNKEMDAARAGIILPGK